MKVATTRERCGVDLMDAIHDRRSIRAYRSRKVEPSTVWTLLDAAVQAPSAVNARA